MTGEAGLPFDFSLLSPKVCEAVNDDGNGLYNEEGALPGDGQPQ